MTVLYRNPVTAALTTLAVLALSLSFTAKALANPVVSPGNISISGGTGPGGAFQAGDIIRITWDNSASGDGPSNPNAITAISADLSIFGSLNAAFPGFQSGDNWVVTFPISAGSVVLTGQTVTITVRDSLGGATTQTSTATYDVDSRGPEIVSVDVPADGNYTTGQTLNFVVNYDQVVNVTGTPDLQLGLSNFTFPLALFSGGSGTTALTFSYTIQSGDLDSVGGIDLNFPIQGGTMDNASGVAANLFPSFSIDTSQIRINSAQVFAPTGLALTAASDTGSSSSDRITNASTVEITGTSQDGALIVLTSSIDGNVGTTLADGSGNWAITTSALTAGTHSFTATASEGGANTSPSSSALSVTVDRTPPTVDTIALADANPTSASSVDFTVTFSESVTGAGTADFVIDATGPSGAAVSAISGSGSSRTVTASTGTGNGSLSIDFNATADGGVTDTAGNVSTANQTAGAAYSISPTVSQGNIAYSGTSGTGGAYIVGDTLSVSWDNSASGDNNSNIASVTMDFSALGGGSAVAATESAGVWSADFTVVADTRDATGLAVAVTATDSSPASATTSGPATITLDAELPVVTGSNITFLGGTGGSGAFRAGDTLIARWDNTGTGDGPNNADTISTVVFDLTNVGGGAAVAATSLGDLWIANSPIGSGTIDASGLTVDLTATDNAGNSFTATSTNTATVDNIAPSAPTGLTLAAASDTGVSNSDGITQTTTVQISGTADANTDITLTSDIDGEVGTAVADGSGNWSLTTSALSETTHALTATATDANSNTSGASSALNVTVDNTAPVVSTTNVTTSGATGTSGIYIIGDDLVASWDNSASGDGPSNADTIASVSFDLSLIGSGAAVAGTNSADVWSTAYTIPSGSIRSTNINISATATDLAGNSASADVGFQFSLSNIPAFTPTGLAMAAASDTGESNSDAITQTTTPVISGTGDAFTASVQLTSDIDGIVGTGSASAASWSVTTSTLSEGTHTITAIGTDSFGNVSSASTGLTVVVDNTAPGVDSFSFFPGTFTPTSADSVTFFVSFTEDIQFATVNSADFAVTGATPTVTVNSANSSTVTLTLSGGDIPTLNGTVSVAPVASPTILDVAGNALTDPTVTGSNDNTIIFVNDVTPPSGYSVAIDQTAITPSNETAFSFAFASAEVGASYAYSITSSGGAGSVDGAGTIATATDALSGIDVSSLPDGTLTLSATLTDLEGNEGSAATDTVVKDTGIPNVPSTPVLAAGSDSGALATDNITNVTTPTITGTADPGVTVLLTSSIDGSVGSGTADGSGNWSITTSTLTAGSQSITAIARDAVGNESSASSALVITLDTSAPTKPPVPVLPAAFDTGISDSDGLTANNLPSISGAAEPNTQVNVTGPFGSMGFTVSDASGNWTFPVLLPVPQTYNFTVTATDLAGNVSEASDPLSIVYDVSGPIVDTQTPPTLGTYGAGETLLFAVNFDEDLIIDTSGGSPILTLTIGSTARQATYQGPSGTTGLVFAYTTVTGDNDADGIAMTSLSANGASIIDAAGSEADYELDSTAAIAGLLVDTTGPAVSSIVRLTPSAETTNLDSLVFRVSFSEAASNIDTGDFSVNGGAGGVTGVSAASGSSVDVTVSGSGLASHDGVIGLDIATSPTITDALGNALQAGEPSTDETYTLDNTAPTVSITGAPAGVNSTAAFSFTAQFSEDVVDFNDPSDVVLGNASINSITPVSALAYTVSVTPTGAGDVSLQVVANGAEDLAGNLNTASTVTNVAFDASAPTVTSITRLTPSVADTAADSLVFRVAFSEDVSAITIADFAVNGGAGSVSAVSAASGTNVDVTVSGNGLASHTGIIGVDIAAGTSIQDIGGNMLSVTEPATDETYSVDNTAPSVTSVAVPADTTYGATQTLTFTLTFDEPVTVTGAPLLPLTIGSTAVNASFDSGSATSALVFIYEVQPGELDTDGITVGSALSLNGASLQDAAGNDASLALAGVASTTGVLVDGVAPGAPLDLLLTAASDTGESDSDGVTSLSSVTITGTAEAGASVVLVSDIDGDVGTGIADGSGNWSITTSAMSENVHFIIAVATDTAGNESDPSNILIVEVDQTPPALEQILYAPGLVSPTSDDAIDFLFLFDEPIQIATLTEVDFAVTGATPVLNVTIPAPIFAALTLSGGDIPTLNGTVTVGLAPGASILDTAGNALVDPTAILPSEDSIVFVNDVTAPSGYSVAIDQTFVTPSNQTAFSFAFTGAELGSTYDYAITSSGGGATVSGTGTITSASQAFTGIDVSGLPDGLLTLSATLTDAESNVGTPATDTIIKDTVAPSIQSVSVPADGTYVAGQTLSFTVTFDEPVVIFDLPQLSLTLGSSNVTANFDGGASGDTTLVFTYTIQPGDSDSDGITINSPLLISAGSLTDDAENVADLTLAGVGSTSGVLVDTTVRSLTIADAQINEGQSGTTNLTFTITASVAAIGEITVDYATSDGSAVAGSDYTATSGTALISDGTTSTDITVPITGDIFIETDETFTVTLSNPVGTAVSIATATATGTITNDDSATVSIASFNPDPLGEADQSATIEVALSTPALEDTTVELGFSGTATSGGVDYTIGSSTVTILAGASTGSTTVTSVQDTIYEPGGETVIVDITSVSGGNGATEDGTQQVTATLSDDDGQPTLSIADVTVGEGDGAATFTVSLTNPSAQTITVDYATADDTAVAGSDYSAVSGTLTFNAGETEQTLNVSITDDALNEASESFTVDLSNAVNATVSTASATGTITDNDAQPTLSIADVSVGEGGGTAIFTVSLDAVSGQTVSVDYATSDGTALAGSDYSAASGTLSILAGSTEGTVIVTITDDALNETSETFAVTLSNALNATLGVSNATGTITDNDAVPTLSIADVTVGEGDGTATFTVSLDAASGQTVTVDYATADSTAVAGADYTAAAGTLTFAAGETAQSVTVTITDDALNEADETLTVDLSNPTNATVATSSATGLITDNDAQPSLSIADVAVGEGDGTATFTVSLDAVSGQTVTVDYTTADGTAVAGADFTAASGTLTFAAGETAQTVTVTITDDALNEADETFTVDLSNPTNATIATSTATASINDNDAMPSLSIADVAVGEGDGTATFTVSLDAVSGQTVTVDYATVDGTAVAGEDYTVASGTLTFAAGETAQAVTVSITDDVLNEADETFTVDLSNPTNATVATSSATGLITNNDAQPTLSIADVSVPEDGGSAVFTVSLSAASGQTVSVDFATADGTAVAGSDYTATSGTLTFNSGETSQTVTVTLIDDGIVEGDESYGVDLSGAVNADLGTASATGTITNDDFAPAGYSVAFDTDPVNSTNLTAVGFSFADATVGTTYDFTLTSDGGGSVSGSGSVGSATQSVTGLDLTALADGTLTLTATLTDEFGNEGVAATVSVTKETTQPGATISTAQTSPVSGAFSITVTFDEDVSGFAVEDITLSNATASNFTATSASVYTADITPSADGTVTVDVAASVASDGFGNPNTAATQLALEADATAPGVVITSEAGDPVSGAFTVTVSFDEDVTGFELADLTLTNGVASSFEAVSASVYTALITPSADGTVSIDIAAGVAQDEAGNGNTAAETFSIFSDSTPPGLMITSGADTVSGVFVATFTFTEDVTGFELSDIAVSNGAASGLTGSGAVYTATITPETIGALNIDVAAGAAQDQAGNGNIAASLGVSVQAVTPVVDITLASNVANPGDVAASVTVTNPGSLAVPFTISANVPWLDIDPTSGTLPPLGSVVFTVTLNEGVNDLDPGAYDGAVTVFIDGGAAPAGVGTQNVGSQVLVVIPISLAVQERFGSIELVATTPSGPSGEASFSYASDLAAFDGLTLTTLAGRASLATDDDILFGAYAINQSVPAGWRVQSISCVGDLDAGSTFHVATGQAVIDLDPGEALVCTFENVRDEDAVRVATQRAIYNFMARRADRIVAAAPDLSTRFADRNTTQRGNFAANMDGSGRSDMAFSMSLAGLRNAAAADTPTISGVTNYERPVLDGWDIWLATEWSRVEDNRGGDRATSDFAVAQLGIDYQLSDSLIVGLMAQYDWMDEVSAEINTAAGAVAGATVEGEGWMAGPYAVWRIRDQLIFDGLAMYGTSDNTVNPLGLYSDTFETDRFMVRMNLTGEFQNGAWRLRPQASLTHFEETQSAYVDSLNITIPEQTVRLGRITAGPEIAWRHTGTQGGYLELSTSLRGVWDYDAAGQINDAGLLVATEDDLRADARFGLDAALGSGIRLRAEAGFSGLGIGRFEATTGRLSLSIPFGAPGRGYATTQFGGRNTVECDNPAGLGFLNAAGQAQACETQAQGVGAGR